MYIMRWYYQDILRLHEKLEERRVCRLQEKAKIAAEEKRIRFEQQQQAAGAYEVEENKFKELRSGAFREIKMRQSVRLKAAKTTERIKAKENRIRLKQVKRNIESKKDFIR